jgi:hypothetical protein
MAKSTDASNFVVVTSLTKEEASAAEYKDLLSTLALASFCFFDIAITNFL